VACGTRRRGVQGLFCSNFGASRGPGFSVCHRAWCGGCYTPHPMDNFHIFVPKDESGFEWRKNPGDKARYKVARNGDHLVTPFQCHFCHFQILTLRNPIPGDPRDEMLLCCLVRANLDACWGRETSTIDANRRNLLQVIQTWKRMGKKPHVLPPLGPHAPQDLFRMAAAVSMLMKLTQPGRHDETYTQFESLRKLRAAYSNSYHASAHNSITAMMLGRDTAKSFLTTCPTQSMWFERFARRCLKRMGQEVWQDLAASIHIMKVLQSLLEREWQLGEEMSRIDLALVGSYALIAFADSEAMKSSWWTPTVYLSMPVRIDMSRVKSL
jgi:hypothetical protein